jgi:hypothetical protein
LRVVSTRQIKPTSRNGMPAARRPIVPWLFAGLIAAGILALAGPETGARTVGCTVKGNISASGERIYHVPGQQFYSRTTINRLRGERWFCSEEAAREAGWRKAKV